MNNRQQKFKLNVQQMTMIALFMALNIILSRFSVQLGPTNRISFAFLSNVFLGFFFGPWIAGIAAIGTDLLKSLMFGNYGGFFIGYTFTAFLGGFIYGLFMHRPVVKWYHIALAIAFNTIISNIILGTLWINIMYQTPIPALLVTRVPQNLIMAPIRFVISYLVIGLPQLQTRYKKYRMF
ncbi:MAG: folate family ECF transporter S component [Aerococcus sp.]|nr:folate family ECF transporter S component [Aerococcus sp.]